MHLIEQTNFLIILINYQISNSLLRITLYFKFTLCHMELKLQKQKDAFFNRKQVRLCYKFCNV